MQLLGTKPTEGNSIPTPVELASHWREEPGFVWLDSASLGHDALSLLARNPNLILEGTAQEWHLLESELELRKRLSANDTLPDGAAIGYFRFDGSFRFGFYDELFLHTREGWQLPPPLNIPVHAAPLCLRSPVAFSPDGNRAEYIGMVKRAQEYIASGDIYQVCLAHRFSAPFSDSPWALYLALREASPAPHSAYLNLGSETILSSSPECFLKMKGRHIMTRPIKGTRPRGCNPHHDRQEAEELTSSPKEIAELVMITDLERNDLGQVCDYGSVSVSELLHLERYAQVFHLVSTVEGKLKQDISHLQALHSCFPGGSISGAPKKRALEIIHELEHTSRGIFTGAIGYLGYNGSSQFNIAIRTVTIQEKIARFHVGAGITADSNPDKEWEETLHKASGILQASGNGNLSRDLA
jgi:aminodeoxychorismate synthase component I